MCPEIYGDIIDTTQRQQNKILRMITAAPWYVKSSCIDEDLSSQGMRKRTLTAIILQLTNNYYLDDILKINHFWLLQVKINLNKENLPNIDFVRMVYLKINIRKLKFPYFLLKIWYLKKQFIFKIHFKKKNGRQRTYIFFKSNGRYFWKRWFSKLDTENISRAS